MSFDHDKKLPLISEDILKMLIDQMKESSIENSVQTKNLTAAVNELTRVITSFPTNKEMLEEFKKHDTCSIKRSKEEIDAIYNTGDKNIDTLKEVIHDFNFNLNENKKIIKNFEDNLDVKILPLSNCLNKISDKIKTMIIIVSVAFFIMSVSYLFVRSSIEANIDKYVEKIKIECNHEIQNK